MYSTIMVDRSGHSTLSVRTRDWGREWFDDTVLFKSYYLTDYLEYKILSETGVTTTIKFDNTNYSYLNIHVYTEDDYIKLMMVYP